MIAGLAIVGMSILAACLYGIAHDLVTAHLCVENFTIGHPPVFPTESPVLLALGWGVIATWWVGLLLGIPLALCSRLGEPPRRRARELFRPIAYLLAAMAVCSLISGIVGYVLASKGVLGLQGFLATRVPAAQHIWFITDLWAHLAAYGAGLMGGIALCVVTVLGRKAEARRSCSESRA